MLAEVFVNFSFLVVVCSCDFVHCAWLLVWHWQKPLVCLYMKVLEYICCCASVMSNIVKNMKLLIATSSSMYSP